MKDHGELTYKGHKYNLVFNLNVMEQIQKEYGSVANWGELSDGSNKEPDAGAVIFGIGAMINEGIDIENDDLPMDQKIQPFTKKQIGRIITEVGLLNASNAMNETVVNSTKSGEKN